tara:strand:+ start:82 stop:2007 length:1926 start_codon:yes stop_codon:yes gene_type:complete
MVHRAERLPVTITIGATAHPYNIDIGEYRRTTVPTLREQRDMSDEPGEQSIDNQFWVRSQTDWSIGAGQAHYDHADSNRARFSSSVGIDPWTKGQISLLPLAETKNNAKTYTNVIAKVFRRTSDGTDFMYVANGNVLEYSSNFSAADGSVTWTTVTALASPQTITDIASDGTTVFIAYGANRVTASTAIGATTQPSDLGSLNPDFLRVVGGRLFGIDGSNLAEYNASGAKVSSSLDSTLLGGGLWVTVCAGPVGFYAASNTARTGAISYISVKDSDGLLNEPQQVAELPRGEEINDMISYAGVLALATTKGLRIAAIDAGSGSVTYGPVIENAGEVYSLAADQRFVWFGGSSGKVYRADLSRFSETLVPAWASDLVSVGDGNSLSNVTHIARSSGKTYFVDSGNGVQGEQYQGNLVASGTLTVGSIRWNSHFDKVLRTIEIRSAPNSITQTIRTWNDTNVTWGDADELWVGQTATVGGTVKASISNDDNDSITTATLVNKVQADAVDETSGNGLTPQLSESFSVTLTLFRDGSTLTAGPQLESWKIQAFPAPVRVDEIILPIILKSRVGTSRGLGSAIAYDTKEEYLALRTAMSNKEIVTYQEGSRSDTCVIDQIAMTAEKLSDDGNWWEGVCTLRLLTVP